MTKPCVVIPAIKKSAVIPDQLVKKLAGKTLIQRALDTALEFADGRDIYVVTDSEEISLICQKAGVRFVYNPAQAIRSLNIVKELRDVLETLAEQYERLVIYRASCPLVTGADIADAYAKFTEEGTDCLVTLKSVQYRLWSAKNGDIDALLFNEQGEDAYIETKSLIMLRAGALSQGRQVRVTPYFLNDRAIEINSYQDWWICEKLLTRRHIVFVVAGYPAIGMGHVFRALMLAHEIADHRVTFLCTKESELAASNIASRDHRTKVQRSGDLADDVLAERPDLVVNDILNTDAAYVRRLKAAGIKVVNFEDLGGGAGEADLVVNALYDPERVLGPHVLYGYRYFCLRDEFLRSKRNGFRHPVRKVLMTFGGTDDSDFTRQSLDVVWPLCRKAGAELHIVAGPGYAHRKALVEHLSQVNDQGIHFTAATNVISQVMEGTDLAICSAGRTVYELAHMRIPSIVLAHHAREAMHTFARPQNGFEYLGCMADFDAGALRAAFARMLDKDHRHELYSRMARFDFTRNKARVVRRLAALLASGNAARQDREGGA